MHFGQVIQLQHVISVFPTSVTSLVRENSHSRWSSFWGLGQIHSLIAGVRARSISIAAIANATWQHILRSYVYCLRPSLHADRPKGNPSGQRFLLKITEVCAKGM
jgi:hypothetical protein